VGFIDRRIPDRDRAPTPAGAVVVWQDGGTGLTGALNVPVAGEALPYNVTFSDSGLSCAAVYGGCASGADLDTTSALLANSIVDAVKAQVLVDNPPAPFNYDTDPTLVSGCGTAPCWYAVPYAAAGGDISVVYIANFVGNSDALVKIAVGGIGNDVSANDFPRPVGGDVQWVRFSVVPLPPALVLFGSGLFALFGWLGRCRRRAPRAA
jgi:hypothetical protein